MFKSHFQDLLLYAALILLLGFVVFMSHVHNDSLASKGVEFVGQVLAAILTVTVSASKNQQPPA